MSEQNVQVTSPLPVPDPDSQPYWDALSEGRLTVQTCADCGTSQHYFRAMCSTCWSRDLAATDVSGGATVYSYTQVHQAGNPVLRQQVPFFVALVDLDEGPRMLTRITGSDVPQIGGRVRFVPEVITDAITLPYFEAVAS